MNIPPIHLAEGLPHITRNNTGGRAFPLGEPNMPRRVVGRPESLHEIIEFLEVERRARYQRTPVSTFCNIYAYDYCYLSGVYLPRVWWKPKAIEELRAGKTVPGIYDETLIELNANALYDWLSTFGAEFGWTKMDTLDRLQEAANLGSVCVIVGKRVRPADPGHIVAVVPETDVHHAIRVDGHVRLPLQSQAGARNFRYSPSTAWWAEAKFAKYGFYVHA